MVDDAMLAAVVRGSSDAVGIIDDTGVVHYVNDSGARYLGYTAEELVGRSFVELTHPDDLERNLEMMTLSAVEQEGEGWFSPPVLSRAQHSDGTWRFVFVTGTVVARTDERTFLSVQLRPADDFVAVHAALRATAAETDVDEALERILDVVRWHHDRPAVSMVWRSPDGLTVLGDPLSLDLCGDAPVAGSPWSEAWKGTGTRSTIDAWPDALRTSAEAHGIVNCWVRPVLRADGEVVAVCTVWHRTTARSLLAWELTIDFVIEATNVALAYDGQRRRLEHAARHDALTGLPNRRAFLDAVGELSSSPADSPAAVLYIDLDGFKPVNDSYGHRAGDAILAAVGDRLRSVAGPTDEVARLGGDEFCVLRTGSDAMVAMELAEQIVAELARPFPFVGTPTGSGISAGLTPIPEDDGVESGFAGPERLASIGASIGVAIGSAADAGTLIADADRALYAAKSLGGRNAQLAD